MLNPLAKTGAASASGAFSEDSARVSVATWPLAMAWQPAHSARSDSCAGSPFPAQQSWAEAAVAAFGAESWQWPQQAAKPVEAIRPTLSSAATKAAKRL